MPEAAEAAWGGGTPFGGSDLGRGSATSRARFSLSVRLGAPVTSPVPSQRLGAHFLLLAPSPLAGAGQLAFCPVVWLRGHGAPGFLSGGPGSWALWWGVGTGLVVFLVSGGPTPSPALILRGSWCVGFCAIPLGG